MFRTFIAVWFLVVSSTLSLAADPVQNKEVPFDEGRFDWGGVYFGIGVGRLDISVEDPIANPSPTNATPSGTIFSGFAGFNRQRGNFVFGFEADGSVGNVSDTNAPFGFLTPVEMEFLATVRGRVGFASNQTLVFATGGVAFASFEITSGLGGPVVSEQFTGFTVGTGIDQMLDEDLFARLEYAYFDLGDESPTFNTILGPDVRLTTIDDGHVFRVSIGKKL